jgi:hypothetical protein
MVTKANPDKPSWGADGKTAVEVPTGQSQQRLKAIGKPELRWDDDAKTALVPVDAIIPAEAYRNADPPLPAVISPHPSADAVLGAEALSSASLAQNPAVPVEKPRRTRRWLLPAVAVLLAFAVTYVAMSMVREMRARPPGAETPSVWTALVKVLGDVRARVK